MLLLLLLWVWSALELLLLLRFALVRLTDARGRKALDGQLSGRSLYFLLPALREQNSVFSTLGTFCGLCANRANVRVVVVTTAREDREQANYSFAESTAALVLKFKQQHDAQNLITHLHYPRSDGNKSHQLNYAIEWLQRNGAAGDDYVGIYDFDAQPAAETVDDFFQLAGTCDYDAIQQVPLPIRRLQDTIRAGRYACATESLLHLQRSLGVEKWSLWFNALLRRALIPHYLCGSGMFIRLSAFGKLGPLPVVDDIPFGYRLYLRAARIGVMNSYNHVEPHLSVKAIINSNVFVFFGVIQFLNEIARAPQPAPMRSLLLLIFGLLEVFEFVLYPFFLLLCLLVGYSSNNTSMLYLTWALLLLPVIHVLIAGPLLRMQIGYRFVARDLASILFAAPWRKFWRACGPLVWCHRKLRSRFTSRPVVFTKTER
jgi:hypothetical protein